MTRDYGLVTGTRPRIPGHPIFGDLAPEDCPRRNHLCPDEVFGFGYSSSAYTVPSKMPNSI